MYIKPEDLVEKVVDEKSFLQFIEALSIDWETERAIEEKSPSSPYGSGALGWENGTIGAFLEAASACGFSHLNDKGHSQDSNPWQRAAEILLAGKFYE